MKLYSKLGPQTVSNEEVVGSPFTTGDDDSIVVPDEFGAFLHATHVGGKPVWEDDRERQIRLVGEEATRRADPATLLAAVEKLQSSIKATDGPVSSADLIALSEQRKAAAAAQDAADADAIEAALLDEAEASAKAADVAAAAKKEAADKEAADVAAGLATVAAAGKSGKDGIEVIRTAAKTADSAPAADLTTLTKPELQDLAVAAGVDKRQNKDELIAALTPAVPTE
jgi:hypothetical protein